jgi:glycosyltransferase involved in cell wall biosynthesis
MVEQRRLRILVAAPYLPFPPQQGFSLRVHHLLRELAARHDITVVATDVPGHADAEAAYRDMGMSVRLVPPRRHRLPVALRKLRALLTLHSFRWHTRYNPHMQRALDELLADGRFDLVQIESPEFWRYRFPPSTPVVLDAHNIWFELRAREVGLDVSRFRRLYQRIDNAKAGEEERAAWCRVSAVLTTSEREAGFIGQARHAGGVIVVPNGVDPEYMRPATSPGREGSLVFTGLMAYRPNADAVRWFVTAILPLVHRTRPDATLTIVGKDVPSDVAALAGGHVTVTGWVPDVRPYLEDARVVVVPLRAGSGTRIKILEAFAAARPVISTTIGAEGIDARPGKEIVIADVPVSFAEQVVRLLDDADAADRLGRAGRALVEHRYSWPSIVEDLDPTYRSIAEGHVGIAVDGRAVTDRDARESIGDLAADA